MISIKILRNYKSLNVVPPFELPDFCVLTGKNGSGKTHLLEAMANRQLTEVLNDGVVANIVHNIPFGGLNPIVVVDCNYRNLLDEQKNLWNLIKSKIDSFNHYHQTKDSFFRDLERTTQQNLPRIKDLIKRVEGDPYAITEEIVNEFFTVRPLDGRSFFSSQFASIFKLYANRLEANDYNNYRNRKSISKRSVLTDEEFKKKYGPKPWELVNEMMAGAGLNYRVNNPEGQDRDEDFHLQLTDTKRGIDIQVNDLSTGERVLLSLALAIYNTNEDSFRPDILLLDEPDAALHPEFSKVLLKAINESIVKKAGVKVIISTHSPTTVALAEEAWIYQMEYGLYPRKVSKKQALSILLKDLEPLRVSVENRRQVFVESRYDVGYYEGLYPLLPQNSIIVPQFLPASTKTGSNCHDVIEMVSTLRQKGNDLVYGIIDYDNNNNDGAYHYVLGGGNRYAIDNYVLDPIFVALLLIRENIEGFKDVDPNIKFTSLHNCDEALIQAIIDSLCNKLGFLSTELTRYSVICGKTFSVNKEYFTMQGHQLEDKIIRQWPQLNAVKHGRQEENVFKDYVIEHVISEYSEYLSLDIQKTLDKVK